MFAYDFRGIDEEFKGNQWSMDGWIKLYRRIVDSSVFADPDIFRLWMLCLLKATYVSRSILIDKEEIILEPGQFITGRKSLSQEYNELLSPKKKVKETTLWHWMQKLKKWRKIDIKSTNKYSLITIVNWVEHQGELTMKQQQNDSEFTMDSQLIDTNKKDKEREKKKKEEEDWIPYL